MASKQLSITVKAVDQATGPIRGMTQAIIDAATKPLNPLRLLDKELASVLGRTLSKSTANLKLDLPGANTLKAVATSLEPVIGRFAQLRTAVLSAKTAVAGFVVGFAAVKTLGALNDASAVLDEVGKASRRLGVGVEQLSALRYGAGLANVEFQGLAGQVATAQERIGKFLTTGEGGRGFNPAIKLLGVNLRDAAGKAREFSDLLPEIADRINRLPDAQRQFAASAIFGDSSVLQFLEVGGAKLRKFNVEAAQLNVLFGKDLTDAAEEYRDSITRVEQAWLGVKAAIVGQVAPALTELLNRAAVELARLPRIAKNVRYELGLLFGGDQAAAAGASERLNAVVRSVLDVAATGAFELAKATALTLVQTVVTLMRAAGPSIADVFRDALAPVIPGLSKSLRGQLADAEAEARGLVEAGRALAARVRDERVYQAGLGPAAIDPATGLPTAASYDVRAVQTGRATADRIRDLEARQEANARAYEARSAEVASLRRRVAERDAEAGRDLTRNLNESAATLRVVWSGAVDAVLGRVGELDAAVKGLGFVGAEPPAARTALTDGQLQEALAARVRGAGAAAWRAYGDAVAYVLDRAKAANEGLNRLLDNGIARTELRARILAASGDADGAARLRLRAAQARELEDARRQGLGRYTTGELQRAQALERSELEIRLRSVPILERLTKAEEAYRDVVARNADLVQAGTLEKFQATRQNQQAAETLRRELEDAARDVDRLAATSPGGETFVAELRRKLEEVRKVARQEGVEAGRTYADGLSAGLREFAARAADVFNQAKEATLSVADGIATGLGDAIVDTLARVKSLQDAFRDFARSVLLDIARVTARMLALQLVGKAIGLFGSISGGGAVGRGAPGTGFVPASVPSGAIFVNSGGLIAPGGVRRFAGGGYVPGPDVNRDVVPALLTPGEFVMNRAAVARHGAGTLARMNGGGAVGGGGGGGGGVSISMSVTINAGGGAGGADPAVLAAVRDLPRRLVDELRRNPTFKGDLKGALA